MRASRIALLGAASIAVLAANPAWAQESTQTGDSAPRDAARGGATAAQENDEILVTATRRAERLSDVPIAISAVEGETLRNSGANDIRQLNQVAPSLLISSTGSDANTSARIRGVGTVGDNPGLESSVAIFVDGVYRSRTGVGMNELGEVDRVEVLRGPQGTLFGRNASAGLIHVVTKAPEFDFRGYAYGSYGNYDYARVEAGVTGPISTTVAAKLEGVYESRGGFYLDLTSGDRVNTRDRFLVRGQLLFEPSSDLSIRAIGDYSERHEACCAGVYATDDVGLGNSAALDPAVNPLVTVLDLLAPGGRGDLYPGLDDAYSRRIAISPGRSYSGVTKDYGGSIEINWSPGDISVTSLTAYRENANAQGADADYSLVDLLAIEGDGPGRRFATFSQELRFQGSAFGNRLDWLIGGYYSSEVLRSAPALIFGSQYGQFAACRVVQSIGAALISSTSPGCLSPIGRAVLGGNASPTVRSLDLLSRVANVGDSGTDHRQKSDSIAAFTHNIIHVTDRVDLTLGLRYTSETKDFSTTLLNNNIYCPQIRALVGNASGITTLGCLGNSSSEIDGMRLADRIEEDEFTGTAVLSWKPIDDLLLYGSYSRGYKAGGFNLDRSALGSPNHVVTPADVALLRFDPEIVDAYEVGAKFSRGDFSLSLAAFRSEFRNFQLNTFDGTTYIVETINGCGQDLGGADRDTSAATGACDPDDVKVGVIAKGVEIESSIQPARYLDIGLGLTYTDTRYADNLVGDASGSPLNPALRRLPGERLSNAPEFVVTSSVSWTPPLGSTGLSGLFFVNARTSSDYNTGSGLGLNKVQDGYTVVNARIGIRGPDQRWGIELWGQNLLNTDYAQVIYDSALQNSYSAYLAEPRTYGLTLRTRF
jgi:iron complex outermembrane recepter protein